MNQLEHWNRVRELWAHWKFHQAAERGYDFNLEQAALKAYAAASKVYAMRWHQPWAPDDIVIEVRGGCVVAVQNLTKDKHYVLIDYDDDLETGETELINHNHD